jgi:hypothetical protein
MTTPATGEKNMTRSVSAILAGIIVNFLALPIDQLFHSFGPYPPTWTERMADELFFLAISYRILLGIASGYVVARVAPRNPMKHAIVLGVLGTVMSLGGALAAMDKDLGPAWYTFGLAVIALPVSWFGATIYLRRSAR